MSWSAFCFLLGLVFVLPAYVIGRMLAARKADRRIERHHIAEQKRSGTYPQAVKL